MRDWISPKLEEKLGLRFWLGRIWAKTALYGGDILGLWWLLKNKVLFGVVLRRGSSDWAPFENSANILASKAWQRGAKTCQRISSGGGKALLVRMRRSTASSEWAGAVPDALTR